jgi:hypothetical protein
MQRLTGTFEWTVLPYRKHPFKTVALTLILITLWIGVYELFHDLWVLAFSIVVLFGSVFYYFFPMRYVIDGSGVTARGIFSTKHRSWDEFKRWEVNRSGIFLSPFKYPSRLDNFRGIFVRFGEDRFEVERRVKFWLEEERTADDVPVTDSSTETGEDGEGT